MPLAVLEQRQLTAPVAERGLGVAAGRAGDESLQQPASDGALDEALPTCRATRPTVRTVPRSSNAAACAVSSDLATSCRSTVLSPSKVVNTSVSARSLPSRLNDR